MHLACSALVNRPHTTRNLSLFSHGISIPESRIGGDSMEVNASIVLTRSRLRHRAQNLIDFGILACEINTRELFQFYTSSIASVWYEHCIQWPFIAFLMSISNIHRQKTKWKCYYVAKNQFPSRLSTFLNEQQLRIIWTRKRRSSVRHIVYKCALFRLSTSSNFIVCACVLVTSLWNGFVVVIWQAKIAHELSKRIKDGGYWIFVHKVTLQHRPRAHTSRHLLLFNCAASSIRII